MSLAWFCRANAGGGGGFSGTRVSATPLQVNGVLYFTAPECVVAIGARTGRPIWHFQWESKGGIHIGSQGVGIYGDWLCFETPDCHLFWPSLKHGNQRWPGNICDPQS